MPIAQPASSLPSYISPKQSLTKQAPKTDPFAKVVKQIEQDRYQRQRSIVRAERKLEKISYIPQQVLADLKKHKIEKFHGIIEPYLKRSSPGTPLLDEKSHRFITVSAERMIRRRELNRADKRDLEHILKTLRSTPRL
ncbi:hypothetical protein HZA86_00130 [Candidatus Uhrbacteria bacterium]|nr:hypothetical protein [Candidatus Uhrbacteria bacterium]